MDTDKFYVQSGNQDYGPFSREKLVSYVSAGKLKGSHLISMDRRKWTPAQKVTWLFPAPAAPSDGQSVAVATMAAVNPAARSGPRPVVYRDVSQGAAISPKPRAPQAPPVPPVKAAADQNQPSLSQSQPSADQARGDESNGLVFISHAKRDAKEAQYLVAALEAAGVGCWIAPRNIPAGSHYPHEIGMALQHCSALLLVYSQASVESNPVDSEVERAFSRGVAIVPVRLEEFKPSPSLEFLTSKSQWIDAFPAPVSRHVQKIVAGVQKALGMAHTKSTADGAGLEYLGNFLLLERLGEGGMGVVRKAEQRLPIQRIVAIKLIKAGFDSAQVLARFESERQAHSRMNHPNIAKVLEAGTSDQGRPYFVMEYVPGIPITEFADKERLSIRERLTLFLQVCDAIAHAHSKQILHRDIKPGNVLAFTSQEGLSTVKVIDFGIAKALGGDGLGAGSANTTLGDVIGTSAYMSPEQAEGSADLDTRSDVYSLGCLLYELLTGTVPLEADTLKVSQLEARRVIREVEPPAPSARLTSMGAAATKVAHSRHSKIESLVKELKHEVEWIPMMAMRKERQRRYESPSQLAADIRNYLDARPLTAAPESRMYRFRKFSTRHRKMMAVVALSIIGTAFYIANVIRAERRVQREERIAKSVNQILSNMLTSGDPKANKSTLTIADAIYNFTVELQNNETNEPLVDATVWSTVGDVQRMLQDYDQSEANLKKAIDLCDHMDGSDSEVKRCRARVLDHLGHVLKDRMSNAHPSLDAADKEKLYAAALGDYTEALDLLTQTPPYDDRDLEIAATRANRANLFHEHDKTDKAALASEVEDCRVAYNLRKKLQKSTDPQVLQSMSNLAVALAVQHDFGEAVKLSEEAVRLAGSVPQGPELVKGSALYQQSRVLANYGDDLAAKNDYPQAEKFLAKSVAAAQAALKIDEDVFRKSPTHYYVRQCRVLMDKSLKNLIAALQKNEKPTEEQEKLSKENRTILDAVFPGWNEKEGKQIKKSAEPAKASAS